jgi:hypothetical protein
MVLQIAQVCASSTPNLQLLNLLPLKHKLITSLKQYYITRKLHFLWHFELCMLDVHIQTCFIPFIPSFPKLIVFCKTT